MEKALIATLIATTLLLPLAYATHTPVGQCDSEGTFALGIQPIEAGVGTGLHGPNPDGVYYIDDRNFALGNGLWIYEESNGIYTPGGDPAHNLQRGGASPYVPSTAVTSSQEICVDDPNVIPDQVLF